MLSKTLLSSREWYDQLARIVSQAPQSEALLELIVALGTNLKSDKITVMHFPKYEGPSLVYRQLGSKRDWSSLEDYFGGNYALDPFYLNIHYCRDHYVASLRDVLGERLLSSEYYNVHYKATGLIDEVCFCCDDKQGGFVLLSFCRSESSMRFERSELDALETIAPMVIAIFSAAWPELAQRNGDSDRPAFVKSDFHKHVVNARLSFGRSILTPREFQTLQLVLIGNSIELISHKLGISIETVKVHRKHIYQKLGVRSQSEVFSLFLDVVSSTEYEPDADNLAIYLKARSLSYQP